MTTTHKLVGEFANDKMEGEGKLTCTNGNSYTGSWKSNFVRIIYVARTHI